MIQIRMTGDLEEAFLPEIEFLTNFSEFAQEAIDEAVTEKRDALEQRLSYEPDPPEREIEWESREQRVAAIIHMREAGRLSADGRYQRSHALSGGWEITNESSNNRLSVRVKNRTGYSRWVVGDLSQTPLIESHHQQRFHAITGWELAITPISEFFDAVTDAVFEKLGNRLKGIRSFRLSARGSQKGTYK